VTSGLLAGAASIEGGRHANLQTFSARSSVSTCGSASCPYRDQPGMQGDRVSGARQGATVQTGLVIQVPLFVTTGDLVKVDTRTGEYLPGLSQAWPRTVARPSPVARAALSLLYEAQMKGEDTDAVWRRSPSRPDPYAPTSSARSANMAPSRPARCGSVDRLAARAHGGVDGGAPAGHGRAARSRWPAGRRQDEAVEAGQGVSTDESGGS